MKKPAPVLAARRSGHGQPVVLIHGLGHHRGAWSRVFDELANNYDVIAPDLPGFGDSPGHGWGARLTVDQACRDIEANFERWGITRPHVVGNSFGGAIALELAARGLAASVTALSPGGFIGNPDRLQTVGVLGMVRARSLLPRSVLHKMAGSPRGRQLAGLGIYADPGKLSSDEVLADLVHLRKTKAFERTLARNALYRFTSSVEVPVTVAWGTRDRILPFSAAPRALHCLPDAEFRPLVGCGHVPMPDDPSAVIKTVHDTIARVSKSITCGATDGQSSTQTALQRKEEPCSKA